MLPAYSPSSAVSLIPVTIAATLAGDSIVIEVSFQ